MNTILDAIDAARKRNKLRQEQGMTAQSVQATPVVSAAPRSMFPVIAQSGEGKAPESTPDTRTAAEKYADAVAVGKSGILGAIPVAGTVLSALNDKAIADYEKANPDAIDDPYSVANRGRFSTIGQVLQGRGYPTQQGRLATSIFDRIFGRTPNPFDPSGSGWDMGSAWERGQDFSRGGNLGFGDGGDRGGGYSSPGLDAGGDFGRGYGGNRDQEVA